MQFKLDSIVGRQIHHRLPPAADFSHDRRVFPFRRPQRDLVAANSYRNDATGDESTEGLSITEKTRDDRSIDPG